MDTKGRESAAIFKEGAAEAYFKTNVLKESAPSNKKNINIIERKKERRQPSFTSLCAFLFCPFAKKREVRLEIPVSKP